MILWHPLWALSCRLCKKYSRTDEGAIRYVPETGEPYPRGEGVPTPCRSCPKVPDHVKMSTLDVSEMRAKADDLTEENQRAYEAYLRFRAVGRFPDDPVVDWYSGIIFDVEKRFERYQSDRNHNALLTIGTLLEARVSRG